MLVFGGISICDTGMSGCQILTIDAILAFFICLMIKYPKQLYKTKQNPSDTLEDRGEK